MNGQRRRVCARLHLQADNGDKVSLVVIEEKSYFTFIPKIPHQDAREVLGFKEANLHIEKKRYNLRCKQRHVESHRKFKENSLPFTLLRTQIAQNTTMSGNRKPYGKKYMEQRTTFLIDEKGRRARRYRKVKPKNTHNCSF